MRWLSPRSVLLRRILVASGIALWAGPTWAEVRSTHLALDRADLARAGQQGASLFATSESIAASGVVEAPFPFTAVAGLANPGSDGELTVRVSRDGRVWSSEVTLPDEEPNPSLDERGQPHRFSLDRVSSLYFPNSVGGPARFLAFAYKGGVKPPTRVTFHFIDAGTSPERPLRSRSDTEDAPAHPLKPAIVSRAAWGARLPKYPYTLTLAKHLAVHHTAGIGDGLAQTTEQCAAQVRAIQAFHQDTRDWNDVGYSYLICGTGEVFQAREDDDDATDVWGAHDGFNRGSMSVSLMGYFHPPYNQIPSEAMLGSLIQTLAWMADIRAIDPLDASLYEAYGAVRTNIYGHREVRATECPGDTIFSLKDSVRSAVAEVLGRFREGAGPTAISRK